MVSSIGKNKLSRTLKRRLDAIMCNVHSIAYEPRTKTGHLYMHDGECADMIGSVMFFLTRDLNVKRVQTWSGSRRDTEYKLGKDGGWRAIVHR